MPSSSRVITKIDKIASAILFVIQTAREELFIVSPYIQLGAGSKRHWVEFSSAMQSALDRGVHVTFISRAKDHYHKSDNMETLKEWRAKGCTVYLVPDLHAKIYYNEHVAIISSLNLYFASTIKNYEIACVINDPVDLAAIRSHVNDMERASNKESIDGGRVVTTAPVPRGTRNSWFKVTSIGSKYAHVKVDGKFPAIIAIADMNFKIFPKKSYTCIADVQWRTVNGRKRAYMNHVSNVKER